MENNSDKEMRDKLHGVEFPFDPKAWEQMESMLNVERKPRAFFWWWFGGVAACLLIAIGAIGYYQFGHGINQSKALTLNKTADGKNEYLTNSAPQSGQNANSITANSNNMVAENKPTVNEGGHENNTAAVPNAHPISATTSVNVTTPSKTEKPKAASQTKSAKSQPSNATNNTSTSGNEKGIKKHGSHGLHKCEPGNNVLQQGLLSSSGKPTSVNGAATNEIIAQAAGANERTKLTEPISIDPILTYEFPSGNENADDLMKKKDEGDVNLKKLKKKIFNYSLGVAANISGSTLGQQTGLNLAGGFCPAPSYMVGLTHDFMFFNRFAITNSIMFSQTSFTVYAPKTTYGESLESYSSKITELAIPIGLKVYAVNKSRFRFYLGAGVINHIKLKETFNYRYNTTGSSGYTLGVLPAQTQFNGGQVPTGISSYVNNIYSGTSDFSINHASRYYASCYATAGAEFIVNKHFVIFAESMFDMALQKVGVQNKYKYNLGLSAGIRYQF